jgi:hypothetical protein
VSRCGIRPGVTRNRHYMWHGVCRLLQIPMKAIGSGKVKMAAIVHSARSNRT